MLSRAALANGSPPITARRCILSDAYVLHDVLIDGKKTSINPR